MTRAAAALAGRRLFAGRTLPRKKYRNVPTHVGDLRFDSKKEAARYSELLLLFRAGEITGLALQPKFAVEINGKPLLTYRADFSYRDKTGRLVVEDVKSSATRQDRAYRIRKKAAELFHHISVTEV